MKALTWHDNDLAQLLERRGRLPHALLFRGALGIGKLALAKALAAGLLCNQRTGSAPACGKCRSCQWIANDAHPDFQLVQPETEATGESEDSAAPEKKKQKIIAIAQIRELADFINMTSHQGGAKVILIHPAEALNNAAFNALLKSLEEPPPATYFLLVSHRPHLLPATIKSRCQQIALTGPTPHEAERWLKEQGVDQPALALAQAGGAPLLALELNDADYWTDRGQFLQGLGAQDFDALTLAERFVGQPPALLLAWLQKWTLDLAYRKFLNKVRYNPDHEGALSRIAAHVDGLAALRYHRHLVRLQRVIEHPLNTRLLYEDLLLGYGRLLSGSAGAR